IDITQLDDVSFPIHSRCEDNWLIVIASGTEPKVADGTVYSYSGWEAVKNLYDSTDAVRSRDVALPTGPRKAPYRKVTMMDKDSAGRVVLREIDPDNPIRTLVIGIVASEDDPEVKNNALVLAEVRRMRLNLIRMAVAGQGGDASKINYGNMYDAPHQPFFADDVSSLKTAIRNALTSVTSVHKPVQASGSVVEIKDAGDGGREFISASYRIVSNNQWEGTLTGYRAEITKNEITGVTPSDSWELGRKLLNKRDTGGGLDVSIWDPSAKKFSSLSQSEAASKNIFGLDGRLTVLQKSGRLSFNEAMYQWVKGYDYSYMKDISYPRNNLLADFSLHSIAVVGKPRTAADSLPGYMEWAEDEMSKDKRKTLYLQTNDGLMHMVDPATGNPRKILLLPPMLVPTRLASLKTNPAGDKLSWLEVTAADGKDGAMRSHPAFTMDGPLQKKDFRGIAPGDAWGTYLLGSLGRGGSGLYMMDVREYDDPKFMWYYEKYGENLISMPPGASAPAISAGGGTEAAGYMKLGYNSPAPAAGVVMTPGSDADGNPNMQNVIIMAGGAQSSADLAQNGREGAVLLVIDPKDGSILRAFDGNSVENGTRVGSGVTGPAPYMGMMVSEPALLRSESGEQYARYTVGRAYAADNRGNIFALMMEGADSPGSVSRLYPRQWSIKTAATLQPSLGAAGSSSNSYAVPYGVVAVKYDDSYWIAGGTSNAVTKKESSDDTGEIQNEKQMIFSFKTSDGQTAPLARNDLQELAKSSQTGDPVMDANGRGWFITLDTVKGFEETVMAKPQIAGDTLYVATFTRTKIDLIGAGDICSGTGKSESGYSRIYAVSVKNGAADFWPPLNNKKMKYLQIEDVKITGLTKVQNRGGVTLWASFEDLSGGSLSGIDSSKARYLEGMNVVEMDTPSGGAKTLIPPGESVIYYWNLK
ncbi:MAG: hypothetical protein LBR87_00505, partial [Synergistaceae bacterium]|nr:hypothetical protein [Synergistaceae bacterium]